MDLYSMCARCGCKIDDNGKEEMHTYPKSAITLLKDSGRAENIELCFRCRKAFVKWLKGEKDENKDHD